MINRREKITFMDYEGRLDRFLASEFVDRSRTYFCGLVKNGHIKVNDKTIFKPGYVIKAGDSINIAFMEKDPYKIIPQEVDFKVVDNREDFLIIDKPAGLLVHPVPGSIPVPGVSGDVDRPTLAAGLLHRFSEFIKFENQERPGIVHRLDKGTSGLMMVAKDPETQAKLMELFKERKVDKTYIALVHGHLPKKGEINYAIGRDSFTPNRMSHRSHNGKPALTYYKTVQYYNEYSLVEVRIVTGRTHQIRVHFASIGHAVVGDTLYGVKSKLIKRQALHSHKVSFTYGEKKYSYKSFIPADFVKLLKLISNSKIS